MDVFAAISYPKNSDLQGLALLGNAKGSQVHEHAQPEEETVRQILLGLKRFRDGTKSIGAAIVDCTDEKDPFTAVALREADLVISLLHADRKGIAYVQAHRALYAQLTAEGVEQLVFPVQRNTFDPVDAVSKELAGWNPSLTAQTPVPLSDEVHRSLVEGRLFDRYEDRRYRAAVETAARTILKVAQYVL